MKLQPQPHVMKVFVRTKKQPARFTCIFFLTSNGAMRSQHHSHEIAIQLGHVVDRVGWQVKMAAVEFWSPWHNVHRPHHRHSSCEPNQLGILCQPSIDAALTYSFYFPCRHSDLQAQLQATYSSGFRKPANEVCVVLNYSLSFSVGFFR